MTLDQLGERVNIAGSQLSLMENGKREPRLSLLTSVAQVLGIELAQLLDSAPPSKRAALEIELDRAQRGGKHGNNQHNAGVHGRGVEWCFWLTAMSRFSQPARDRSEIV